jgi:phenylacetic acid degradation operon negative regulatory protein
VTSTNQEIGLPRAQIGPEPQRLLTVLLGDYWYWESEPIPSRVLVNLLAEFDITDLSARAAMRRLAARGLLSVTRSGRTTAYGTPRRANHVSVGNLRRLFAFGASPVEWDGLWTLVAFSVPESERDLRRELRDELRLLGFGPLFDALWVSPHDRSDEAREATRRVGVDGVAILRSEIRTPNHEAVVAKAFDGSVLRGYYRDFIDKYAPVTDLVRQGRVSPHQALLLRTACMLDWRQATINDAGLPDALLPTDWPLAEARKIAIDIYDSLGPLAAERFRQLLAEADPQLANLVRHHTFADVMALSPPQQPKGVAPSDYEIAVNKHRLTAMERARGRQSGKQPKRRGTAGA